MIYIPDDTLERLTEKTASIGDVFVVSPKEKRIRLRRFGLVK